MPAIFKALLMAAMMMPTACVTTPELSSPCQPLSAATLERWQQQQNAPDHVVFFASWCVSCRDAMTRPRAGTTVLIGMFDEPQNLERVYVSSGASHPCFIDDGTAEQFFGVKSLPFETSVIK